MISHRNVIANVLQICTFEKPHRESMKPPGAEYAEPEVALGLLPQSHIYSLVVICHATTYRGDQVINLPKFEIQQFLNSIQKFKITILYVVGNTFTLTIAKHCPLSLWGMKSIELSANPLGSSTGSAYCYCHDQEQSALRQIRSQFSPSTVHRSSTTRRRDSRRHTEAVSRMED